MKAQMGSRDVALYSLFNLDASWGRMVEAMPRPVCPQERPGAHYTGGWVGPRAGLDGCGKSRFPPAFHRRTVLPVSSGC